MPLIPDEQIETFYLEKKEDFSMPSQLLSDELPELVAFSIN